jgi:hypothetical protein|tara:strand:- start:135 stop:377 length:243 start_codon:yes stop_codon:yes gene_type:complete
MPEETLTAQEIAQHYSAASDSVTLINELVALSERDDEQVDTVRRNVEHLEIMVAKDFWTTEDLAPLNAAITAGTAVLPAE